MKYENFIYWDDSAYCWIAYDETQANELGRFPTREEAEKCLDEYNHYLETGSSGC